MEKTAVSKGTSYQVQTRSALSFKNKVSLSILTILWFAANYFFWGWWFDDKSGNAILYFIFSVCSLYIVTILPGMYLFYLWNMRYPIKVQLDQAILNGAIKKIALISLTVPGSESLQHVERQMKAMCKVRFPHDTWILVDKYHSPEIKTMAERYGVKYFSRHDVDTWDKSMVEYWNQPGPPFQAKTKAGNVNAWLDAFGSQYSHFTQLDIDHNPKDDYLLNVLGFFADDTVKWVQAPSVYRNLDTWTSRGSAEQELILQGPLQMGFFGFAMTPMIIGSHCTYDTLAVMEIGGFQPTRAEDHLDTVLLSARGYRGVFLPEVIAEGEGPETFETYLGQQFAWAYSLMQILFRYTPRLLSTYGIKRSIQFLFAQTWYPLWSVGMCCLYVLPTIGLYTGQVISPVGYFDYVAHSVPLGLISFAIYAWSTQWHQPKGVVLSWRSMVLHVARWPVVLSAFIQVLLRVEKPYMITPKGVGGDAATNLRPFLPYLILMMLNLVTCAEYIVNRGQSQVQGYLFFSLQGVFFMLTVYAVAILNEWRSIGKKLTFLRSTWLQLKPLALLLVIIVSFATITRYSIPHIADAWTVEYRVSTDKIILETILFSDDNDLSLPRK